MPYLHTKAQTNGLVPILVSFKKCQFMIIPGPFEHFSEKRPSIVLNKVMTSTFFFALG